MKTLFSTFWRRAALLASILAVCAATSVEGELSLNHANVRAAAALQKEVTSDLMALDGILGTAVGVTEKNHPSLVVFVEENGPNTAAIVRAIPPQLRGIAVRVELTEKFRAFARGGSAAPTAPQLDHKGKQTLPIRLGTSGGWRDDSANGYCCGGTLGSLIQVTTPGETGPVVTQYILSNYHVLEADIVPGGNAITAEDGDFVIQPGLIDVVCNAGASQAVGTLVKISSLPNSNVDAAIAQVLTGAVSPDGAILGIGTISAQTRAAALNLPVKKAGRTTGLTRSKISGLNATIRVSYENECAGGPAFTHTFTGQIVINNKGSAFLAGGDSGSLMVEDIATGAKAVGLLYAGSKTSAIANPIGEVLSYVGSTLGGTAAMVGN